MEQKHDPLPEKGALLFLDGQMVFRHAEARRVVVKPLSPTSVRAAFNHIPLDSGWLPAPVRRWGQTAQGEYLVLHFPAQRYRLCLHNQWPERFSGQKWIRVEAPLPSLVFAGHGQAFFLWAMVGDEFDPEAEMYLAPLPNVHFDGRICFGANHPPAASPKTVMTAWEMFIASPFNNHLSSGKSHAFPNDVGGRLLKLADRRARRYPRDDLITARTTLHQAIERMISHQERWT